VRIGLRKSGITEQNRRVAGMADENQGRFFEKTEILLNYEEFF
jgi:hypothetical protein